MRKTKVTMLPELFPTIEKAKSQRISNERKQVLKPLIDYIQSKISQAEVVNLNFICTHNSRRSQFAQIWAQTAADYFGIPANCYSGGVEVTAFNERAVASIRKSGFRVSSKGKSNPVYFVFNSDDAEPISAFSKLFDDPINKADQFATVMTCSHADENCPFIPGTEKRIPVRYDDPKEFDDTPQEAAKYDERSLQIAAEMFYVFSQIKKN
uniref:Protein-tyrosine-phosphatase n=1 Tax=Roseihalotalea indica TaxID=2867963 RepID=A0AA49JEU8_9BACT|nr:protein-tyrosine-phosphatase [Tunicatimonas sp. TK19036]